MADIPDRDDKKAYDDEDGSTIGIGLVGDGRSDANRLTEETSKAQNASGEPESI